MITIIGLMVFWGNNRSLRLRIVKTHKHTCWQNAELLVLKSGSAFT